MSNDEISRRYVIEGRVQGVGFRWWTKRMAKKLGLRGTVRNREDGSVEVCAGGSIERLRELEAALNQGPRGAKVEKVNPSDATGGLPPGFEITR